MSPLRAIFGSLLILGACSSSDGPTIGPVQATPQQPTAGEPSPIIEENVESSPHVVFETGAKLTRVFVEIASSPSQVQRGLMFRSSMPDNQGMIFLMGEEKVQSFWMKNTLIPLDMIFVREGENGTRTVAGIVENAEPETTTSRFVEVPSSYVIEVNGGFTKRHGIRPGTAVRFVNIDGR